MAVGDPFWNSQEDARKAADALRAAEAARSAKETAASIERSRQLAHQEEAARAARQAEDLRHKEAKTVAASPSAPPVQERKKSGGGFFGFIVLVGVIALIVHAKGKTNSSSEPETTAPTQTIGPRTPFTPSATPVQPAPEPAPVLPAPEPAPAQPPVESTAGVNSPDEPLTELPTSDDLPYFMTRPVVESDLRGKSSHDLNEMILEIVARHGDDFHGYPASRADFDAKPWYHPTNKTSAEIDSELTNIEKQNINLLARVEKARE